MYGIICILEVRDLKGENYMEQIKRGDIISVDLGDGMGSEQEGVKYCVVIQNDIGNKYSTTTIVAPISKIDKAVLSHVEIRNVLPLTSYILCEQIRVIEKSRIIKWHSKLSDSMMDEVAKAIRMQLSI